MHAAAPPRASRPPLLPLALLATLLGLAALGTVGGGATPAVIGALRLLHSGLYYHPDNSHSLYPDGYQSVLCARNTGIYAGALLAGLWALATGRGRAGGLPARGPGVALALGFAAMAADGLNSLVDDIGLRALYAPTNELRLATGLLAGLAVGVCFLAVINSLLWRAPAPRPVVPDWRSLGGLLLAPAALWLGLALGLPALSLPLAVLTAAASLALFGAVNLLFLSLVLRWENRFDRAGQLGAPAAIAVAVAVLQLGGLAWLVQTHVAH
jgi:uncharacterized membrane protein